MLKPILCNKGLIFRSEKVVIQINNESGTDLSHQKYLNWSITNINSSPPSAAYMC